MPYAIASFRSRQQVFAFESALKRMGLRAQIVSTPREVALGCGLSVRFELQDIDRVADVYRRAQPGNLIGFYRVDARPGTRPMLTPLGI
ncbi:hypothetical protein FACS1894196_3430 [Clostridia bacterium]|nr:hypothetical protein FACS1894196_3430 [Clostridia bacterium]